MSTYYVKKLSRFGTAGAADISGLKSSRYEKLQVSYGYLEAGTFALNDVINFSDVPARDIIRATVVVHPNTTTLTPVSLDIYPATANTGILTLKLPNDAGYLSSGKVDGKISYIIEYVRGTGKPGYPSAGIQGEEFRVQIAQDSTTASAALKPKLTGNTVAAASEVPN